MSACHITKAMFGFSWINSRPSSYSGRLKVSEKSNTSACDKSDSRTRGEEGPLLFSMRRYGLNRGVEVDSGGAHLPPCSSRLSLRVLQSFQGTQS
jgi:hypothetical protein